MEKKYRDLIEKAFHVRKKAYSPYSHFKVGAALFCKNGKIYLGCNIQNGAYLPTTYAERTPIFKR